MKVECPPGESHGFSNFWYHIQTLQIPLYPFSSRHWFSFVIHPNRGGVARLSIYLRWANKEHFLILLSFSYTFFIFSSSCILFLPQFGPLGWRLAKPASKYRVGKSSTFLIFAHISIIFPYFSSIFPHFCPHFGPQSGGVAHPGRPWLRHLAHPPRKTLGAPLYLDLIFFFFFILNKHHHHVKIIWTFFSYVSFLYLVLSG